MKILKLRFKNIHSLRGEHEIDFTKSPFTESGLFAITGPTGAGKSTILDVITLSLFSRIPRFDGKITNTEIEKIGSVMTHFTDDAYAEIDYQCKDRFYRSTWSISKTSKGKLKDYNMMLSVFDEESMVSGSYIGDKKSMVPTENEEIIGLNYEQFIRSILLSQGEFAKFLKSDEKERAKLLEDITGSQIYRIIGKKVFEKTKVKREEIALIMRDINGIISLSEEQINEKQEHFIKNVDIIESHKNAILASTYVLNVLQKKDELQIKLEKLNVEKKTIEEAKINFRPKEEMWAKHQNLSLYRNDIVLIVNESQRLENLSKDKLFLSQQIDNQQLALTKILSDVSDFVHTEVDQENLSTAIRKFEQNVLQLDTELKQLTEDGRKLRNRINSLCTNHQNTYTATILNTKNIDEQLAYVQLHLQKLGESLNYNLDDVNLNGQIESCRVDLETIKLKYNDALRSEEATTEIGKIQNKILQSTNDNQELEKTALELLKLLENVESEILVLEKKKEEQVKISSLEDHRNELQDGEPCPLCGSTDHPYAHEKQLIQIGKITLELGQKIQIRDTQKLEQSKVIAQKAAIDERIILLTKQIEEKKLIIKNVKTKWQINENETFTSQHIKNNIDTIQNQLDTLIKEQRDRNDQKFLLECIDLLKEISNITKRYKEIKIQKDALYQGQDISMDVSRFEKEYKTSNDLLTSYKLKITNLIESEDSLIKSIQNMNQLLEPALEDLGYDSILDAKKDILDEIIVQNIQKQKEELTKSETQNDTNIKSVLLELESLKLPENESTDLALLKENINQLTLEKDQLLTSNGAIQGELEQDQKNKTAIVQKQSLLQKTEEESKKWIILDDLIGDSTGNKYSKFAQNLSLKHLINLANKRLTKLTDRYLLASSDIETDLTIIDLYQGSVQRSVKTLSGGESFIVSLAMALSLSDMASKNVKLESLFIDEGFGSLDAETLETALETLERLQSESNRMIGIISHVDSLKERITTQIRVKKSNQGYSLIEVK